MAKLTLGFLHEWTVDERSCRYVFKSSSTENTLNAIFKRRRVFPDSMLCKMPDIFADCSAGASFIISSRAAIMSSCSSNAADIAGFRHKKRVGQRGLMFFSDFLSQKSCLNFPERAASTPNSLTAMSASRSSGQQLETSPATRLEL